MCRAVLTITSPPISIGRRYAAVTQPLSTILSIGGCYAAPDAHLADTNLSMGRRYAAPDSANHAGLSVSGHGKGADNVIFIGRLQKEI